LGQKRTWRVNAWLGAGRVAVRPDLTLPDHPEILPGQPPARDDDVDVVLPVDIAVVAHTLDSASGSGAALMPTSAPSCPRQRTLHREARVRDAGKARRCPRAGFGELVRPVELGPAVSASTAPIFDPGVEAVML
jgi:hypothetical protein